MEPSSQVLWTDILKAAHNNTKTAKLPKLMRANQCNLERTITITADTVAKKKIVVDRTSQSDTFTVPGTKTASWYERITIANGRNSVARNQNHQDFVLLKI